MAGKQNRSRRQRRKKQGRSAAQPTRVSLAPLPAQRTPLTVPHDTSRCLFCDRLLSEVGRAKEHIFPQWLLRAFNEGKTQIEGQWWEFDLRNGTETTLDTRRLNL